MQYLEKGTYTLVNQLPIHIYDPLEEAINAYQHSINSAWNDSAHFVDQISSFERVSILDWTMDKLTRVIINYMTFLVRRGEKDPALELDPNRLVSNSAWWVVSVLRGDRPVIYLDRYLEFLTQDLRDVQRWCTTRCAASSGIPDFVEERVAKFEGRLRLKFGPKKEHLYREDYETYKSVMLVRKFF